MTNELEEAQTRKARVFADLKEIAQNLILEGRALMNDPDIEERFLPWCACDACLALRQKLERGHALVTAGADVMILRGLLFRQTANNRFERLMKVER